ncbi:MAG TPA: CdaR family protein [Candidatus Acidoferrum sp.]|nr:CdaR family protein [Candidatus Acidoferrum sp.]
MKDKLIDNPGALKVASLVLAILLWFYMGIQNPETEVTYRGVPVKTVMQNAQLENGVSAIGTGSETVDITLRGNKSVLSRIAAEDIYATIEVDASLSPGVYYLPINVTLPLEDAVITGKYPAGYDVRVDRMVSTVLPVRAEVTYGIDTDTYIVDEATVKPDTMEVRGPEADIAILKEAVVKLNVTEGNLMEERINLPVAIYDTTGAAADSTYLETTVRSAAVYPRISVRRTLPVTVDILSLPEGWLSNEFSYTVSPSTIEIKVPVLESSSMTEYSAGQIDIKNYHTDGVVTLPIAPEYLQPGDASEVTVTLTFGELASGSFELAELEYDHVPQESYVLLSALPLEVSVRGTPEAMAEYDGSKLRGIVDLSSAVPGATLDLPVRIVTGDQEVGALGSVQVTVRVGENNG